MEQEINPANPKGAGRKPGDLGRLAREAVARMQLLHPGWHPLMFLADIAQDATQDLAVRIDCAKAMLPYMCPRVKPVEADPDAAIDLEARTAAAKAAATVKAIADADENDLAHAISVLNAAR